MRSLEYPAQMEPNGEGGFIVSFRDIPEALTEGWSIPNALEYAQDVLIAAAEDYVKEGLVFPEPTAKQDGDYMIELPFTVVIKMRLLEIMLKQKIRPADLARRMGIKPQKVTRILDFCHATRLDTLDKAFKALNMTLTVSV